MPGHLVAACPNEVWAIDFVSDQTADGRPLKILTVTDEHTREALATPAARRMGADDTVDALERIVERRGHAPKLIRCDNGPEFIAQALRDWCRFNDTKTGYIAPGAPWQNPFVESFNGHLRRELLDLESFNTLYEAQLLLDDWRLEYNHYRPHQSLNLDLTADELDNQAELALTQQSLDSTDDPYLAVDGQPLTNFERLLSAQMPGRDHLVAAPKLIAIVDPSHRRTARYAPSTASGTEPARSSPARRLSEVGLTPAANRQQTSTRSP